MKKTQVIYIKDNVRYSHTFSQVVTYGTIEQYLIMQKHIGKSQVAKSIVGIKTV